MKKQLLLSFTFITSILFSFSQTSDTCAEVNGATAITEGTYTVGPIDGTDVPTSNCDGVGGSSAPNAEWLRYVPNTDLSVIITSDLSVNGNTDTKVNIFSGDCNNLVCVVGDDNSGELLGSNGYSFLSYAIFEAKAGTTYYIVWDNKFESEGFDFQLIENPPLPEDAGDDPVVFTVQSAGLSGTYDRGLVDMNGDYLDDILAVDADAIYLALQNPDGSRTVITKPTSVADFVPTWSLSAGDYNADGFNDLMYGSSFGVTFMRTNQSGAAGFDSVTYEEVSGPEDVYSQRNNFVDINNDGLLDAFASEDTDKSVSYINDGSNNLVFTNDNGLGDYPTGGNYASIWIDFDNDRDIDMFMAKCSGTTDLDRRKNELYMNNGDGTFTEIAESAGLDDLIQTWSAAWGDFDNDGDLDIYIGGNDRADHKIMRNNGDRTFTDVTNGSGIGVARRGIENVAGDLNNDGFLDVAANGTILYGNGDLTFNADSSNPGVNGAIGDINNDGFLDFFNGALYVNGTNSNNWIKIITIGDQAGGKSNINGIGARVEINTETGTQIRDVMSGVGFRYMSSLNTHFGIGDDTNINYVRIYWPSGVVDNIINPTINQPLTVVEGETLGVSNNNNKSFRMYPNPANNLLNFEFTESQNDLSYSIFDISGKTVIEARLDRNTIDISALSTGAYIIKLISDSNVFTQKFIKI